MSKTDTVRTPSLSEFDAIRKVLTILAKLPDESTRRKVALAAAAAAGIEVKVVGLA